MNVEAPVDIIMRRMTAADNAAVARVIRQVSAECGLTADKGYTVADPNLDVLYTQYSKPGYAYWVIELDGEVVGGGGIAPLVGSETDICELQKNVFSARGARQGACEKAGVTGHGFRSRAGLSPLLSRNHRLFKRGDCAV